MTVLIAGAAGAIGYHPSQWLLARGEKVVGSKPKETLAGIGAISEDLGFAPITAIAEGAPKFFDWHMQYHGL